MFLLQGQVSRTESYWVFDGQIQLFPVLLPLHVEQIFGVSSEQLSQKMFVHAENVYVTF